MNMYTYRLFMDIYIIYMIYIYVVSYVKTEGYRWIYVGFQDALSCRWNNEFIAVSRWLWFIDTILTHHIHSSLFGKIIWHHLPPFKLV